MIFVGSVLFVACGKDTGKYPCETKHNSLEFKSVERGRTSKIELDEVMDITEWYLYDTLLICKNDKNTPCYYVLNTSDFSIVRSFGKIGKGRNEWVAPHLLADKDGGCGYVLDNGKRSLYSIGRMDTIEKMKNVDLFMPANGAKLLSYPIYTYTAYTPNVISLYVADVETSDTLSSISFHDTKGEGMAIKYDFFYDIKDNNTVVLGFRLIDRFIIASMSDTYQMCQRYIIEGEPYSEGSSNRYYTDVVCDDYIYLLSQRNVNGQKETKTSQIEIYDYEGNPIKKIVLDIFAVRMLKDRKNGRMLLLSPNDECIHILQMNT